MNCDGLIFKSNKQVETKYRLVVHPMLYIMTTITILFLNSLLVQILNKIEASCKLKKEPI